MLLVQPSLTCTNAAGPDLLQLARMVYFLPLAGTSTPLTDVVVNNNKYKLGGGGTSPY